MTKSRITCELDLDAPGKHAGFLRIPHSVHRSAYGWIGVPITVIRGADGPTMLMLAGVHGDEYEGQIALSKLARDLRPDDIRGRLIVLPMTNQPAAAAGLRTSPIDDGNLNRAFPGNATGGPTDMLAHYIEHHLMGRADYMVDLHSGGTSLFYPPTLLRGQGHSAEETAMLTTLQDAFDLPYAWVFQGGGGKGSSAPTCLGAANRNGVIGVMAELGGGGGVDRDILRRTERGVRRILHAVGMLPDYEPDAANGTRELHALGLIAAHDSGLFEPFVTVTEPVTKGQVVGAIHHPDTPWRDPEPVTSHLTGTVLCQRALAQVQRGDALFQIANDVVAS